MDLKKLMVVYELFVLNSKSKEENEPNFQELSIS